MLEIQTIKTLNTSLYRIFALPIVRSTFREVQTAIMICANHNPEIASQILEVFFTGKIDPKLAEGDVADKLRTIINQFSVSIRVSKDVFERGEFINVISSDLISNKNNIVFINHLRRIDGQETQFLSDIEGTIYLLQHFAARLQELKANAQTKEALEKHNSSLEQIKQQLNMLL